MMRKSLLLLAVYFLLLAAGCCNCSDAPVLRFRWTQLAAQQYHYEKDNSGNLVSAADTAQDFATRDYMLRCKLQYELIARKSDRLSLCFGNVAYACKCDAANFKSESPAVGIRVFTLQAFDQMHPANSEVTDCFKTLQQGSTQKLEAVSHDFQQTDPSGSDAPNTDFDLYLVKKPDNNSLQQFRVEISLTNGSVLSVLSQQVRLN